MKIVEVVVVALIVGTAALFLIRKISAPFRASKGCGGCGCSPNVKINKRDREA